MTGWLVAILVAALTVSGAAFSLIAAIGLNRLPDVYTRMHAASKAGTVGSGLLLLAWAFIRWTCRRWHGRLPASFSSF